MRGAGFRTTAEFKTDINDTKVPNSSSKYKNAPWYPLLLRAYVRQRLACDKQYDIYEHVYNTNHDFWPYTRSNSEGEIAVD